MTKDGLSHNVLCNFMSYVSMLGIITFSLKIITFRVKIMVGYGLINNPLILVVLSDVNKIIVC